jgi:hypothetical protein
MEMQGGDTSKPTDSQPEEKKRELVREDKNYL